MKIEVDGVELTIENCGSYLKIFKVIGRDRTRKQQRNILHSDVAVESVIGVVTTMKRVAAYPPEKCTCDYRYGYSDHAEHCRSIHVATEYRGEDD